MKSKAFETWIREQSVLDHPKNRVKNLEGFITEYTNAIIARYAEHGKDLSRTSAEAEMIANFVGDNIFKSEGTLEESLAKMTEGLDVQQSNAVVGFIKDFIAWVKSKVQKLGMSFEDVRLQRLFAESVVSAKETVRAKENTTQEAQRGVPKRSLANATRVVSNHSVPQNTDLSSGNLSEDATLDDGKVNQIKSVYPWDDFKDRIISAAENGKLIVTNKNKAKQMLTAIGISSSEASRIVNLAKESLSQNSEFVNTNFENSENTDEQYSIPDERRALRRRLEAGQITKEQYDEGIAKLAELLSAPGNKVIYNKKKDASQRSSSSTVPSLLNDTSFYENSIPQNTDLSSGNLSEDVQRSIPDERRALRRRLEAGQITKEQCDEGIAKLADKSYVQ